jgi:hypothetical protein
MPGTELHGELRNRYKIKLLKPGCRLVYRAEQHNLSALHFTQSVHLREMQGPIPKWLSFSLS